MKSNEVFPPQEKFINPFTDEGFKRIFGSEINKEMIILFLNSLLNECITDISFRNVEALGLSRGDRKAVFDIFCETSNHELIIVEVQKNSQKYFSDRVLYYASFAIQQQWKEHNSLRFVRINFVFGNAGLAKVKVGGKPTNF